MYFNILVIYCRIYYFKRWKTSVKYIFKALVFDLLVKLKIFKVFRADWGSIKWPFWGGSWSELHLILPESAKIFTTGRTPGNKNSALRLFEKLRVLQKRERPRVCTFGPAFTPFFPWKRCQNKKEIILNEKTQPLVYPKLVISRRISFPPLEIKNGITFCTFWVFFGKNRDYLQRNCF